MSNHPDSASLIKYIRKTTHELIEPLEEMLWSIWEPGEDPVDGINQFGGDLFRIGIQVAHSDGELSRSEVLLIHDVMSELSPQIYSDFVNASINDVQAFYKQLPENVQSFRGGELSSLSIEAFKAYDAGHGTEYAELYRTMLFRFANILVKADGKITANEERHLRRLKSNLWGEDLEMDDGPDFDARHSNSKHKGDDAENLDGLLLELNSLIGLETVKSDVTQLVNFLRVQKMRQSSGMAPIAISRHLVFYGNPGTGKTTVARLIARVYHALGVLNRGHLIETDRSGMVAGYVGQTALKVKEIVESAIGGVLFIDEAYTLAGSGQDYGQEAVDMLLKLMEDNRDDLIVVVAGYSDKMAGFISSNPGLRSRFNKYFHFADYEPEQLLSIYELFCKNSGFKLTPKARTKAQALFQALYDIRDTNFGNARVARNLFEQTINHQANRIITIPKVTEEVLGTIEAVDIPGEATDGMPSQTSGNSRTDSQAPRGLEFKEASPIRFPCPGCSKPIKAPAKFAGRSGECPNCSARMTIPQLDEV